MAWVYLALALFLILFAYGMQGSYWIASEIIASLKILIVAIVMQAIFGMAKSSCPDLLKFTVMLLVAILLLIFPWSAFSQVLIIVFAGIWGALFLSPQVTRFEDFLPRQDNHRKGFFWLIIFFVVLIVLNILNMIHQNQILEIMGIFYKVGAMVFGGGHVVLPLLQAELVSTQWVSNEVFLAGYGATQLVPGPLFTFAAFLGASITSIYPAWLMGLVSLLAIFAPSFFLVMGVLPFWSSLRKFKRIQAALMGINAVVVGMLLAALYDPILTNTMGHFTDIILGFIAVLALMYWRLHVIYVAILICVLSYLFQFIF